MNGRIVQVTYSLGIGGSEVLARDIAACLKRDGLAPAVAALEKGGALEKDFEALGIPFYVAGRKPGEYLSAMWRLYRFFRKLRPDVVHTHHLYELFYSVLGAKLVGARLVHTEHERFSLRGRKARLYLKVLSHFCDRITTVAEEVTEYIHREVGVGREKLLTIGNGVDLERYKARPSGLSRKALGLSEGDRVAVNVARLERVKDHDTLLDAFGAVRRADSSARLLIVGDGGMRAHLEERCKALSLSGCVKFLGARRDVPEILALSDVFVLSSVEEGLPIAILEAMASAKPVVSTGVGGIGGVVEDGVSGLLVQPGSPSGLAAAIKRVFDDRDYARSLGQRGRAIMEERFDFKDTIDMYRKVYSGT